MDKICNPGVPAERLIPSQILYITSNFMFGVFVFYRRLIHYESSCYDYCMTHIGLARGIVKLYAYDNAWPLLFSSESEQLQKVLNVPIERIQHVGSTSIPNMVAKPIVDIAILVDDLAIVEKWEPILRQLGYWYKGFQIDMPDRRFFAKGPEQNRTVYLHVVNIAEFKKLTKFRDTLKDDVQLAKQYKLLKQKLSSANASNRASYSRLKNNFIQNILNHQ